MKKNEHYFPTMELIKDASDPCGWRRVTYKDGKAVVGEVEKDGIAPLVDARDEADGGEGSTASIVGGDEADGTVEAKSETTAAATATGTSFVSQ